MESQLYISTARRRRETANRDRAARIKRVIAAREEGLSLRAIAVRVNLSPSAARRILQGAKIDRPEKVTGMDGRAQAATKRAKAPQTEAITEKE